MSRVLKANLCGGFAVLILTLLSPAVAFAAAADQEQQEQEQQQEQQNQETARVPQQQEADGTPVQQVRDRLRGRRRYWRRYWDWYDRDYRPYLHRYYRGQPRPRYYNEVPGWDGFDNYRSPYRYGNRYRSLPRRGGIRFGPFRYDYWY